MRGDAAVQFGHELSDDPGYFSLMAEKPYGQFCLRSIRSRRTRASDVKCGCHSPGICDCHVSFSYRCWPGALRPEMGTSNLSADEVMDVWKCFSRVFTLRALAGSPGSRRLQRFFPIRYCRDDLFERRGRLGLSRLVTIIGSGRLAWAYRGR